MFNENEYFFQCPYCFEQISMIFEMLYKEQEYIEDCEVCCKPILIKYKTDGEMIEFFEAIRID